jgi:hypothetical protein
LTVVKLGGSYAFSPELPGILAAIEEAAVPVVLVPGGGPFADAVRDAQPRMGFDDRAAHRMALLAMAQYAEALACLHDGLRIAANLAAIGAALDAGEKAVWSPWPMADGLETLPESWDLTSDSLSAWLAAKLGASRLLLLKHRDPPDKGMSLAEAAQAGIVDRLFPEYAGRFYAAQARSSVIASVAKQSRAASAERKPAEWLCYARNDERDIAPMSAIGWVGQSRLSMLTAILEGRTEAWALLRPAFPA